MSKSLASALDPLHAPRRGRGKSAKSPLTSAEFARAALGEIEDALDRHGWPWNPQLSLLIVVYGYRNREIMATGPNGQTIRDHVEREIIPTEAATVRRIFEEIAQGRGFARIAKGLTADGVPSPRLRQGWAPSGVREMVFRDLYRGRIVWGKTKWSIAAGPRSNRTGPSRNGSQSTLPTSASSQRSYGRRPTTG